MHHKGKLIAIEGTDGSGKHTQTELLAHALREMGKPVKQLSFPNYGTPCCAPVELYLNGGFGAKPEDVNAYAASTFYAVDRFASYQTGWKQFYEEGGIVLTDRYTISNAIHQGEKLHGMERTAYLEWLFDFEYRKIGIPAPDRVVYLSVPPELSWAMKQSREAAGVTKADIHEQDYAYLAHCAENGLSLAGLYRWNVIECSRAGKMKTQEEIHAEIFACVNEIL